MLPRPAGFKLVKKFSITLRKLAYAIYRDFFSAIKIENFISKNSAILNDFAQNIDCGYTLERPRRGGSNEYPQSMFWIKSKKNRYTLVNPSFFYIKVGFKGAYISWTCFPDACLFSRKFRGSLYLNLRFAYICTFSLLPHRK